MREQLLALYQLQQIDSQALEVERSAESIPNKIAELEAEVETLRVELGGVNAEAEQRRKEQREIEAQISEETSKHRQWKKRLNDIRTPREYQALSRELELGERQVRDFEDSVLSIMNELEEKGKVISERDAALKDLEAVTNARIRELRIGQAELKAKAEAVRSGRKILVESLPENLVAKYEQVRKRRNGIGVSVAVSGSCSGCNVAIRPQLLVEVQKYNSIEACPTCQRLIVHEELVRSLEEASS